MKPLKISIPKPCHEDWSKMTLTEKGRFCDACKKCVIDFTYQSDREIVKFFRSNPGKVCGNFRPQQLNRLLEANTRPSFSVRMAGIFLGLAAALGLHSKGGSTTERPMARMENHLQQRNSQKLFEQQVRNMQGADSTKYIAGTVFDGEHYRPLLNAKVTVQGIEKPVFTDKKGEFRIEIPATWPDTLIAFTIEKKEFEFAYFQVSADSLPYTTSIVLFPFGYHEPMRGDIMIEE